MTDLYAIISLIPLSLTEHIPKDVEERGKILKKSMKVFLEDWIGEKCPDYEPSCVCCQAWESFDKLFVEIDE
jgi:hypothetical protein